MTRIVILVLCLLPLSAAAKSVVVVQHGPLSISAPAVVPDVVEGITATLTAEQQTMTCPQLGLIHKSATPATMADFTIEVDDSLELVIPRGADYRMEFVYAAGETPAVFQAGQWPKAEFRTARSPSGAILAPFTIVIENESMASWSINLSAAQTTALAGKTGLCELSMPDFKGGYYIWSRLKCSVVPMVTAL